MDSKTKELARLLCAWNRKELSADDAIYRIWKLYDKETSEIWNNPLEQLLTYAKTKENK